MSMNLRKKLFDIIPTTQELKIYPMKYNFNCDFKVFTETYLRIYFVSDMTSRNWLIGLRHFGTA